MPKTSGRLLALLSLLQARRDWPGALLAERLEVSARTVRRDVDRLRELGYPIATTKGPDGGYRLGRGRGAAAAAVRRRAGGRPRGRAPDGDRRRDRGSRGPGPAHGPAGDAGPAAPPRRRAARHRRRPGRARGRPGGARHAQRGRPRRAKCCGSTTRLPDGPPRRAEPHHLVTRGGRWYLVAWDLDRDDWRTFRVDRITPRVPTGPRFAPRELPGRRRGGVRRAALRGQGRFRRLAVPRRGDPRPARARGVRRTPATAWWRNWARTAAGSCWGLGRGRGWPPRSAGSTPISRSSDRGS